MKAAWRTVMNRRSGTCTLMIPQPLLQPRHQPSLSVASPVTTARRPSGSAHHGADGRPPGRPRSAPAARAVAPSARLRRGRPHRGAPIVTSLLDYQSPPGPDAGPAPNDPLPPGHPSSGRGRGQATRRIGHRRQGRRAGWPTRAPRSTVVAPRRRSPTAIWATHSQTCSAGSTARDGRHPSLPGREEGVARQGCVISGPVAPRCCW